MTEEELTPRQKNLRMMRRPDDWPQWPCLPLVRREMKTDKDVLPEVGLLWDEAKPTVYFINMFALGSVNLTDVDKKEYMDWDALLDDGWVVD
jgi:hypothetical protein